MTGTTTGTVTTLTGLAAILAMVPAGVPGDLIAFGAITFWAGCWARTGSIVFGKLNSPDPVTTPYFIRQFAMLLCCIPLAVVASALLFLAALALGADVNKDAFPLLGLLLTAGIRGPEGFSWLTGLLSNVFENIVPGQKPGAKP